MLVPFGSFKENFHKFSFDDCLSFLYLIIYERKTHVGVVEVEVEGHTPHDDQTHWQLNNLFSENTLIV